MSHHSKNRTMTHHHVTVRTCLHENHGKTMFFSVVFVSHVTTSHTMFATQQLEHR